MIVVAYEAFGMGRDFLSSLPEHDRSPFREGYCGKSIRFEDWGPAYPQHYPCYLTWVGSVADIEGVLTHLPPETAEAWRKAVLAGLAEEQADEEWRVARGYPPLEEKVVMLPGILADGSLCPWQW